MRSTLGVWRPAEAKRAARIAPACSACASSRVKHFAENLRLNLSMTNCAHLWPPWPSTTSTSDNQQSQAENTMSSHTRRFSLFSLRPCDAVCPIHPSTPVRTPPSSRNASGGRNLMPGHSKQQASGLNTYNSAVEAARTHAHVSERPPRAHLARRPRRASQRARAACIA